jgi:hypothetical protein
LDNQEDLMKKSGTFSRTLKVLVVLLSLAFLTSQNQSSAVAAETPRTGHYSPPGPTGFIDVTIWAEGFGYDGANWIQTYTVPVTHYIPTKDGVGLDRGDMYTFESVNSVLAGGLGWVDCGWGVKYEVFAFISNPPECKLSIAFSEYWLPGMCWGCVASLCDVNFEPAETIYEGMYAEFIIGQDILKTFPVTAANFEGSINILINHVAEHGLACEHHAFLP